MTDSRFCGACGGKNGMGHHSCDPSEVGNRPTHPTYQRFLSVLRDMPTALDVKCPTCLAEPDVPCAAEPPTTMGDYGPEFHEARCPATRAQLEAQLAEAHRALDVMTRRVTELKDARTIAQERPTTIAEHAPLATPKNAPQAIVTRLERRRLGAERRARTKSFKLPYVTPATQCVKCDHAEPDAVSTMKFYFTSGEYPDGTLGEVFVKADRQGSLASGALDMVAIMISLLTQYGVPLEVVTAKLKHGRFEPSGRTGDPKFRSCTSPLDLLAQWLEAVYGVQTPA